MVNEAALKPLIDDAGLSRVEWLRLLELAVGVEVDDMTKGTALKILVRRRPGFALGGLPAKVTKWWNDRPELVERLGVR